jgi:uncharacterized protein (DUF4415 family)
MKSQYNFSKSKPNLYLKKAQKQITIRLDAATIDYFKGLSEGTGIPCQSPINLYLRECAAEKKRLKLNWVA